MQDMNGLPKYDLREEHCRVAQNLSSDVPSNLVKNVMVILSTPGLCWPK